MSNSGLFFQLIVVLVDRRSAMKAFIDKTPPKFEDA